MKKLLLFVLVLGCAGLGWYYYAYDRLPWEQTSPEDMQISALKEEFTRIRQQWTTAGRTQGLGADAGSQTEGVLARLDKLDRDVEELTPRIKGTQGRVKLANLRTEVAAFKMNMR